MIQGLIFDLDGVLVDTARYHFKAWQKMAEELGSSFTEEQNESLKGVGRKESLEKILAWGNIQLSEAKKEEAMQRKNKLYLEMVDGMAADETLPGARAFLEASVQMQLKIALGSASKNAKLILEKTQLLDYFDHLVDGTMTNRSKPDPQVFTMGAEKLGLSPNQIIVFEDSIAGVKAALDGGFACVGIGEPKVLEGAHLHLNSLGESTPTEIINRLNFS